MFDARAWFDRRSSRIVFGLVVGAPLTATLGLYALNAAFWGSVITFSSDAASHAPTGLVTMAAVFGLLGLIGAWLRLLHDRASLFARPRLRNIVVSLLALGIAGSLLGFYLIAGWWALFAAALPSSVGIFLALVSVGPNPLEGLLS
jgi:hypothetical protein